MSTANELRELKVEELQGRVTELRQQMFDMKSKLNTGTLGSTADLAKTRREVARCLTLAREAELGLKRRAKTEKQTPRKAKAEKPAKKAGKAKE
jgi:large subunit ribosomal protein L29